VKRREEWKRRMEERNGREEEKRRGVASENYGAGHID
jgi:hypothetical protein